MLLGRATRNYAMHYEFAGASPQTIPLNGFVDYKVPLNLPKGLWFISVNVTIIARHVRTMGFILPSPDPARGAGCTINDTGAALLPVSLSGVFDNIEIKPGVTSEFVLRVIGAAGTAMLSNRSATIIAWKQAGLSTAGAAGTVADADASAFMEKAPATRKPPRRKPSARKLSGSKTAPKAVKPRKSR